MSQIIIMKKYFSANIVHPHLVAVSSFDELTTETPT